MKMQSLKKQFAVCLSIAAFLAQPLFATVAKANNACQVDSIKRTLVTDPAENLEDTLSSVIEASGLTGKVVKTVLADGLQGYEYGKGEEPTAFGPSATLYPFPYAGADGIVLTSQQKIGDHYMLNKPVWEFSFVRERLLAKSFKEIEGAKEGDIPWLVVETNIEGYYIFRIETRGGIAPQCGTFKGVIGIPYQTLYIIFREYPAGQHPALKSRGFMLNSLGEIGVNNKE